MWLNKSKKRTVSVKYKFTWSSNHSGVGVNSLCWLTLSAVPPSSVLLDPWVAVACCGLIPSCQDESNKQQCVFAWVNKCARTIENMEMLTAHLVFPDSHLGRWPPWPTHAPQHERIGCDLRVTLIVCVHLLDAWCFVKTVSAVIQAVPYVCLLFAFMFILTVAIAEWVSPLILTVAITIAKSVVDFQATSNLRWCQPATNNLTYHDNNKNLIRNNNNSDISYLTIPAIISSITTINFITLIVKLLAIWKLLVYRLSTQGEVIDNLELLVCPPSIKCRVIDKLEITCMSTLDSGSSYW